MRGAPHSYKISKKYKLGYSHKFHALNPGYILQKCKNWYHKSKILKSICYSKTNYRINPDHKKKPLENIIKIIHNQGKKPLEIIIKIIHNQRKKPLEIIIKQIRTPKKGNQRNATNSHTKTKVFEPVLRE